MRIELFRQPWNALEDQAQSKYKIIEVWNRGMRSEIKLVVL